MKDFPLIVIILMALSFTTRASALVFACWLSPGGLCDTDTPTFRKHDLLPAAHAQLS